MKRVIALLILALCLVIAFAVLTGGGGEENTFPSPDSTTRRSAAVPSG